MNYLPDLYSLNDEKERWDKGRNMNDNYFRNYERLDVWKYIVFQVMALNECYFDNKDAYEYVTAVDFDETILPRTLTRKNVFDLIANMVN